MSEETIELYGKKIVKYQSLFSSHSDCNREVPHVNKSPGFTLVVGLEVAGLSIIFFATLAV